MSPGVRKIKDRPAIRRDGPCRFMENVYANRALKLLTMPSQPPFMHTSIT